MRGKEKKYSFPLFVSAFRKGAGNRLLKGSTGREHRKERIENMGKRIILGSASPRRRELLRQIGVEFEVMVSKGEEKYKSAVPEEIVKELALEKAENVSEEIEKCTKKDLVIIGADTIVVLSGEILGKPVDEADAFRMLKSLQGRVHRVYTGVALLDFDAKGRKQTTVHVEKTDVYVHEMEQEEIRRYIATKESMDKAGAYGVQGKFASYIDRIEGDYYNVVGLPIAYVYRQLKQTGWEQ